MIDGGESKRKTITLAGVCHDRARTVRDVDPIEYVQAAIDADAAPPVVVALDAPVHVEIIDDVFMKRIENWRKTVRGSLGGGSSGYCAGWAKLYTAAQLQKEIDAKVAAMIALPPMPTRVMVDELDGWLVEAAVRSLIDYNERKVLHYWYVFQYPEHWIKTKLLLRRSGVMLVKGRAENNLRKMFTRLENAANILSNNLHAGNVPRPESIDAHVGASLTLEKVKALIE